jgi:two-component system chemotaxis response regulator CheB
MHSINKISVLIVDDSFFMRKMLREILESDPKILVVGTAKDGEEAVVKSLELNPDVITMDYNMPIKNGVEAIKEILKLNVVKKPSVIMISAHTTSGSSEALDCLRCGAVDFITKPSGELSMDIDKMKDEILLKIHMASMAKVTVYPKHKKMGIQEKIESSVLAENVIVIGASTGGPPLVEDIIEMLPKDLSATVIIAQHMPPYFISRFAERLDKLTPLSVSEAKDGDYLTMGKVYLVPADFDFVILENKTIRLNTLSYFEGANPSIDRAMESVVRVYGKKVVGVILSGMGQDGLIGAKRIKQAGGVMIAQEPSTAAIDSMPNAIISAGLADKILSPNEIPIGFISLIK